MNKIARRQEQLPVKAKDLQKWLLIGKAKLAAQMKALKGIRQLTDDVAAVQAALEDTQDLAEILLYAEAGLGRRLEKIPKQGRNKDYGSSGGTILTLPPGIDKKQSHYAQELSRNEDAIAEVVAEAREKGEVPVRNQVLRAIQKAKPKPKTPALPAGKYNVIYADPPWKYADTCEEGAIQGKGADKHYPVMSIDELCALGVRSIAGDNSVLFLWVTSPILAECFDVISAWGFEYKASFVWDKVKHNMGHYNSVRHEFLLICTRGSYVPENKKLYDSVQSIERTKHSEKPEQFRKIIETLYPSGKKIELFARKKSKGWATYGNDTGI